MSVVVTSAKDAFSFFKKEGKPVTMSFPEYDEDFNLTDAPKMLVTDASQAGQQVVFGGFRNGMRVVESMNAADLATIEVN